MFMSPDEFPLPWEYRAWTFERLVGEPPEDVAERTIVFLDCGNIDRMPVDFLRRTGSTSSTSTTTTTTPASARSTWWSRGVLHGGDRLAPRQGAGRRDHAARSPTRSTSGLVTDTGRFMYENTTPEAHRMAAELIEAGVEPHEVYRRLYEDLPFRRLQLLQRALASIERHDDGVITVAHLVKDDYEETGRPGDRLGGVVDHLRAVEGTAVAVLVRELLADDRDGHAQGEPARHRRDASTCRGSPASSAAAVTAGGRLRHDAAVRRAGGELRGQVREQLESADRPGSCSAQAGGGDVARRGGRGAPSAAARHARWAMPARSTRSPPACCWCWSAGPRAPSAS